jgi:hypothetical protein
LHQDVAKLAAFRGRDARATQVPMRALPMKIIFTLAAKSGIGVQFLRFSSQKQIDVSGLTKFNGEVFLRAET